MQITHSLTTPHRLHFCPRMPSATKGIVVIPCVRLSVRLSVLNGATALSGLQLLKFFGLMHSTIMQITIKMAMLGHFFARFTELWHFRDKLKPGLRDGYTAITLWGFQLSTRNLLDWCPIPCSWPLFKMAMLGQICVFHVTLKLSMILLDQVWGIMPHTRKCEEITSWPDIWRIICYNVILKFWTHLDKGMDN